MTIRILVNGAQGKMGQQTVKALDNNQDGLHLVAAIGKSDDLSATIEKHQPDIVIDFTNAEVVFKNTETIITHKVRPIIGTSGLLKNQIAALQQRAAALKLGGIIVPNFSLGAILMMKYAKEIARYYDSVEIIESHHAGKIDSPSGTSLRTAELISSTGLKNTNLPSIIKESLEGARGAHYHKIPIHSIRIPGVIANQEVIFGAPGETLSINHVTIDRQCFMPGVILACKKVMELDRLVYGLEELV